MKSLDEYKDFSEHESPFCQGIDIKRRIRQDSPFRCRHPLEQMSMFNFNLLQIYEKKSKSG